MSRRRDPDSLLAEGALLPAARALCEAGRHEEAANVFARLCMDKEAARCKEHAGDLAGAHRHLLAARDFAEAAEVRGRLLGTGPPIDLPIDVLQETAASLMDAGRAIDAAPLYEAAGDLEQAVAAHLLSGGERQAARLESRLGRHRRAADLLRAWLGSAEAGEGVGSRDEATRDLARALLRSGGAREAVCRLQKLLDRASSVKPELRVDAVALLLRAFEMLGHPAAVEEVWITYRDMFDDSPSDYRSWLHYREEETGETGDDLEAPVIGGRYRLETLLGAGGSGQVFRALDEMTGRAVAVKLLSGASAEEGVLSRFFREARIARGLAHPGLVKIIEAVPERGYLVMELLPGGTLADRLLGGRRLPVGAVRDLGLALSDCVGAIHRRGVLHRDIKPQNILFDEAARPRLGDLGAAHLVSFRQTESGLLLGTVAYMAPEQLAGERLSAATDVFALAVTLYRALTGRLPFPGPDLSKQHEEGAPRPSALLDGLPAAVESTVDETFRRALHPDPMSRLPDASSLAEALESWPTAASVAIAAQPLEEAAEGVPSSSDDAPAGRASNGPPDSENRYEVLFRLGSRVSAARDRVLHRMVVLERAAETDDGAWMERVKAVAAAGSPNLQAVLDVDETGGLVVWQWLDGEPLSELQARDRRDEVMRASADLARALVSVHDPTILINLRAPSQASGKARRGPEAERTSVREHRTAAATPKEAWIGARPRQDRERLRALGDHPGDVAPRRVLLCRGRIMLALAGLWRG